MTTEDYLKITGYSKEEWTVLDETTSKLYKNQQGAVNNMYPISDKKFIKALGTGYNLVNLAWREKHRDEVEIKEVTFQEATPELLEAKKTVDSIIPSAVPPPPTTDVPTVSGMVVPPPPPNGTATQNEEIEDAVIVDDNPKIADTEEDFFCEKSCQTGLYCEKQCEDCKTREHGPGEETEIQKIKEIVEESGIPKENVVVASIPKTDTEWKEKRIAMLHYLGLTLKEGVYSNEGKTYGISEDALCNKTDLEFNASVNAIKKHIESLKPKGPTKCSDEELSERIAIAKNELAMTEVEGMLINEATQLKWPINSIQVMSIEEFDKAMATNLTIINTRKESETKPLTVKEINILRSNERIKRIKALGLKEEEYQYGNGTQAISKEWIRTLTDEKFDKEFEILEKGIELDKELDKEKKATEAKVKEEEKKAKVLEPEKVEVKKEVVKPPVIEADEKTIADFEFLDNLIDTATKFKKTAYAITLIKNTLKCDDLTPAKKIVLIEKAVNNIK